MGRNSPILAVVLSSLAVLVVAAIGWFAFISPQRSKADKLDTQETAAQTELAADQTLLAAPRRKETAAENRTALRAMPEQPQVSSILRQLSEFATESRTELDNITPGSPTTVGTATAIPISLSFKGRYFGLQKLLKLLNDSADVREGKLVATGRLYTVDSIQFGGSEGGEITAQLAINAFTYNGAVATATAPSTTATTSTDTTAAPAGP